MIGIAGGAATGAASAFWGPVVKERFDRRRRTAELRDRYSPPLLQAAFDLQSRLYNIVRQKFLQTYLSDDERMRQYAEYSTLWLLGQYLGWREILRREVQFLDFESSQKNRALQTALDKVASELATDSLGRTFAVFRTSQRAIGELMIVEAESAAGTKRHVCLGYAEFVDRLGGAAFSEWFAPLGRDLNLISQTRKYARFVRVQRALVDLIDLLDPDRVRYPTVDGRGKLPVPIRQPDRPETDGCARLARFTAHAAEYGLAKQGFPAPVLAEWATRHRLALRGESDADAWSYIEKDRLLGARLVVHATHRRGRIEIYGAAAPPGWAKALRLAPRDSRWPLADCASHVRAGVRGRSRTIFFVASIAPSCAELSAYWSRVKA